MTTILFIVLSGFMAVASPPAKDGLLVALEYLPGGHFDEDAYRLEIAMNGQVRSAVSSIPISSYGSTPEFTWEFTPQKTREMTPRSVERLRRRLNEMDYFMLEPRYSGERCKGKTCRVITHGPLFRIAGCREGECRTVEIYAPLHLVDDQEHPNWVEGARFMALWYQVLKRAGPMGSLEAEEFESYVRMK